jgi:predicted secreted hydrolase
MQRRNFLIGLAALPGLLRAAETTDFAPVVPGRRLVFPADHGAHPDFRTEWWYATGWLRRGQADSNAAPLGFQITFFRVRTGIGENSASRFAPSQLLLAHAAIADPAFGRLQHSERSARAGFGRAGFATDQTRVWINDWRLEQDGGNYRAQINDPAFAYDLILSTTAAPMLNGVNGFSRKAADPRHASYYYSRPQLAVSGRLTLGGKNETVTGHAWIDHEWSSELLPEGAQGWDWVGINLHDGGALMAFRLRDAAGKALWAAGTLQPAGGPGQTLAPADIDFAAQRQWQSPRTGIDYPVNWQLRVGDRLFAIEPLLDDQELDSRRSTGAIYWEGAIRVHENGRLVGEGYLEMTGWRERIRVGG